MRCQHRIINLPSLDQCNTGSDRAATGSKKPAWLPRGARANEQEPSGSPATVQA
jgi:hypothetical protein